MKTLTMKCPECLPDHRGAYFDAEYSDELKPVWKCRNCGYEKARGSRRRKLSKAKFERIAAELRDAVVEKNSRVSQKEVKKFETTYDEDHGFGFVVVEVGMFNDEGTMAALTCRDYRHIHVTHTGAVKLVNPKEKGKARGWFNAVHALTS